MQAKSVSTGDGLDGLGTEVAAGKKLREKDKPRERDKAKEMARESSVETSGPAGGLPTSGGSRWPRASVKQYQADMSYA